MTPVLQTIHGYPHGNCFQACIASILDLPIEQVPHFMDGGNREWWESARAWAAARDMNVCWIDPETDPAELMRLLLTCGLPYIAIGPSFAGDFGHCVVMKAGEFVHDPSGRGRGLAGPPWLFVVFERKQEGNAAA